MKEVVAIIRPERWQATREAAARFDVVEAAHLRALGRGRQRGLRYLRRVVAETGGAVTEEVGGMQFLAKRIVTWLAPDDRVREFVATVIRVNQTGNFGDGKIFVCPVEDVSAGLPAEMADVAAEASA